MPSGRFAALQGDESDSDKSNNDQKTIAKVLKVLDPSKVDFDETLDSVDAMPTREIYLHEGEFLAMKSENSYHDVEHQSWVHNQNNYIELGSYSK